MFNSCYLKCWFFIFLNTGVLISLILLVSFCPDHRGRLDTAANNGVVLLSWKQSKFYLRNFCNLNRKEQGLILQSLGFIQSMVFELLVIDQKSVSFCRRLTYN